MERASPTTRRRRPRTTTATATSISPQSMACALASRTATDATACHPKAIDIRFNYRLEGVNGNGAAAVTSCQSLSGWFEGRLDWVSGGTVVFQERGPFLGVPDDHGEVQIF